jgi:TP901 family phage tail tape measure protein
MANLEKTVNIIFAGKDELSVTTRRLYKELDDFGGGVRGLSGSLSSFADKILTIDATMNALVVGGLLYAYKKTIEFSSATADLNKVLSDTEKVYLKGAQKEALKLSETYGESSSKTLQSMANFKQAGFNLQESMELTKNSLDLVIAGDVQAAEASEYLVSTLKGFKAPASDAARLVDILNEVSNEYATDVKQLAIGMSDLSPIAHTMGFSFEETAGILTPVIEVFRSGSESAMALKTGLLKLIDDAKPVREALASIGVNQKDANGQLRSGKDILADVSRAFQGLDQNQKLFVTQQLVGIEQSARMVEVFNGLNKSTEVTSVAMKSAGSAAKEVAIRLAEPEVVLKKFMTGIENLGIAIGGKFKDSLTGIVSGGVEIEKTLSKLIDDGTFAPIFDALNKFALQAKDYLSAIAKNLPAVMKQIDWTGVINSFDNLGSSVSGAFKAIFGNLDLTTVEGLKTFIQKLVDAFAALNNVTAGVIDGMRPLFSIIGEGIDQFGNMNTGVADLVGNILGMAKSFYITTTYLQPMSDVFTVLASSFYIAPKIMTLVSSLRTMEVGMFTLNATMMASPLAVGAFAVSAGVAVGALAQYIPGVTEAGEKVGAWVYDLVSGTKTQEAFASTTDDTTKTVKKFGETVKTTQAIGGVNLDLSVADVSEPLKKITEVSKSLATIPATKTVKASLDKDAAKKLKAEAKEIETALEWKAKVDITQIEEQSKVMQKALEIKGKIDVAELEEGTKRITAAFESVNNTITVTGNTIQSIVGSIASLDSEDYKSGGASMIWAIASQQMSSQKDAVAAQVRLIDEQIEMSKSKRKRMEAGEGLISIKADGMEPEIQAFMWKILSKIQVRVNEAGSEMLLGI